MSSLLNEYRALEARLKSLQSNKILQHEIEFESRLKDLLKSFDVSPTKAIEIIKGAYPAPATKPSAKSLKVYKNPHTGEEVEAANILKHPVRAWCDQYGKEEVKKWATAA